MTIKKRVQPRRLGLRFKAEGKSLLVLSVWLLTLVVGLSWWWGDHSDWETSILRLDAWRFDEEMFTTLLAQIDAEGQGHLITTLLTHSPQEVRSSYIEAARYLDSEQMAYREIQQISAGLMIQPTAVELLLRKMELLRHLKRFEESEQVLAEIRLIEPNRDQLRN